MAGAARARGRAGRELRHLGRELAREGLGTPAIIAPTRHLVVSGLYRYVRNPMYVGVVAVIAGQAIVFADRRVLLYAVLVWLAFHLFVVAYEEPTLSRTVWRGV